MPRYFIDTDDGRVEVADDEGHDLPDGPSARDLAHDALTDMARDSSGENDRRAFSVRVRSEDGGTLYSASLTLSGAWWGQPPSA